MKVWKSWVLGISGIILLWFLLTFRILEVPPGMTSDEAALGYNGVLLEKTLYDENHRLLPVFVLSNDGQDWKQPVTQYLIAATFKIFGPSYFNLRATSVFLAILSVVLLFFLLEPIGGTKLALTGIAFFLATPIILIQSHLGLDNIAPVPFVILWLIGLYRYKEKRGLKYLVLAAIALAIGFFSYKGMRLIVPVWTILSIIYIRPKLKTLIIFSLATIPFIAAAALLQKNYANSILDHQSLTQLVSYQVLFNGLLANLDPSFLFISGDTTFYHSTGKHGMLLLASIPFFLLGVQYAVKERKFPLFILIAFLSGPLLFGLANSLHRASRLLALVPPYAIICAFGALWLTTLRFKFKKIIVSFLVIIMTLNFIDFVGYYFTTYPEFSLNYFSPTSNQSYIALAKEAKMRGLEAYIEDGAYQSEGLTAKFFEQAYFSEPLKLWKVGDPMPVHSILLTNQEYLPDAQRLPNKLPVYHLQVSK